MSPSRPLGVLVVDDEPGALEALRRTLEDTFALFTAGSGAEGLQVLERESVQVVVSEQRMPGMSGVEFLRTVRERWPDTIRMILSASAQPGDSGRGIGEAGIWQFLLKPWRPDQLLPMLHGAAQVWRLQQENQRLALELRGTRPAVTPARDPAGVAVPDGGSVAFGVLRHHVERVEAQLIRDAMERHHGNKTRVAGELGLTRVGLRMKLAKLGLPDA